MNLIINYLNLNANIGSEGSQAHRETITQHFLAQIIQKDGRLSVQQPHLSQPAYRQNIIAHLSA